MVTEMIFNTVGGLGLFIFGMSLMSDGLKKAAGQKLKQMLESMTRNPLIGFSVGTAITALVQSSSATTVMIIGLVNAGLLTLRQAICVIFGTNVGTTATAWIVALTGFSFKITTYSLPIIATGVVMDLLGKTRKTKSFGQILIGFGILFIGIGFMKDAFGGLKGNEGLEGFLVTLATRPMLALLAGTVITMLLQSSSASIMIIQTMAITGSFGTEWENALNVAIPFVLGGNIGTTITAQIASIGTNLGSRRTAMAHTLFNVIGSGIALPFIYMGLFGKVVHLIAPWELSSTTIGASIAVAHTFFNVVNSMLFLPFASVLEKIVISIVPSKADEDTERPVVLERHLINTPEIALDQAKREIIRMAKKAKKAVFSSVEGLLENDLKKLEKTRRTEDSIDEFQHEITAYLVILSKKQLNDEVSIELPVLLHMVNDLERVGDHAINIAEIAERKIEQKQQFSDTAQSEAKKLFDEIGLMLDNIIIALAKSDVNKAKSALRCEKKINRMQVDFRRQHVQRVTNNECSAESGLIFIDLVDNVEKIGDHLTNIAQSVIGGVQWDKIDGNTLSGEFEAIELE